jgi:hypothetical protein
MKITKENKYIVGGLIITGIIMGWLYLIALNGRYMYSNMEGDDLIIDKWTKSVYLYQGEPKLKSLKEVQEEQRIQKLMDMLKKK